MFAKISFDPNVSQSKHLIATYVFSTLNFSYDKRTLFLGYNLLLICCSFYFGGVITHGGTISVFQAPYYLRIF